MVNRSFLRVYCVKKGENMTKRASNIELLKVLALIIIVIAHNAPASNNVTLRGELEFLIDGNCATENWQFLILIVFFYLAQLAVCIFLVCSAWFFIESKAVKPKKVLYMWADLFFISVTCATVIKIIYPEMPWKAYIESFFPLTMNSNWYILCYLLLYAVHPLLNIIIHNTTKQAFLISVLISSVMYCIVDFVLPGTSFYFNSFIGFVVIYFIVAYVKLNLKSFWGNKKENLLLCACSFFLLLLEIAGSNFLELRISGLNHLTGHWRTFTNPLIIVCAITLFNLFRMLRIDSRIINYISSCSMLIYIIHENWLFREYVRTDYFGWVYYRFTYNQLLLWCFLLALISFVASLTIAILYKSFLQKLIYRLCDRIYVILHKLEKTITDFIFKLN